MNYMKKMTVEEKKTIKDKKNQEMLKQLNDRQLKMYNNLPDNSKYIYLKAITGTSKANALKVRCLDCCAWQPSEVKKCPAVECSLHKHRPYMPK